MGIRLFGTAAAVVLAVTLATAAGAQQNYPAKIVRIVVPYTAGGAVDPMARLVADRLSKSLGQSFVVENRPGAGGNIGIDSVVRSPHDGYTLLATPAAVAINPSLYSKVPYDIEKDLTPVGLINRTPMVVLATPSFGVKSVAELVARAKAKPGTINYAIAGNGTLDHLICERLKATAGLDMLKVNYQGVPKGITALLTGEVQMMVVAANAALPYVTSGQVVPLAVTSAQRSPKLPDVPTMAEAGFDNFVMYGWSMLFAPSGVPQDIVQKLHAEIANVVAQPDVSKLITDAGGEIQSLTPEQLKTYVRREAAVFADVVRTSGARAD